MKRLFLTLGLACTLLPMAAHDFSMKFADGQVLYFNVLDSKTNRVELTYPGTIKNGGTPFRGDLNVPSTVTYNGKTYKVAAIGKKAFSGATSLTSVILPTGLTEIGDFAFEECFSLRRIMFPGNKVKFGSGTFFRCHNINSVTLGSDWTEVELKMFRWTKNLKEINIPAKTMSVRNLKSLKGLQRVTVDANNPNYKSIEGALYTKNGQKLLSCPRGYLGKLKVAEGTTVLGWGALQGCNSLTQLVLPSTLSILSFREFAHMKLLNVIVMKNDYPIATAETGGKKVFLLQMPKTNVKLIVSKDGYKNYKKALVTAAGDYKDLSSNLPTDVDPNKALLPYHVAAGETLTTDYLFKAKDISEY